MNLHNILSQDRLRRAVTKVITEQRGSTATEYGMLVSFLALALVIGVTAFGQALNLHYQSLATALRTALGIP
ncbi:Flp family type IVb pilin [Pseudarthrobacter oxydans]